MAAVAVDTKGESKISSSTFLIPTATLSLCISLFSAVVVVVVAAAVVDVVDVVDVGDAVDAVDAVDVVDVFGSGRIYGTYIQDWFFFFC